MSSPIKVAALSFNSDGRQAAYAVRRSSTLPREGSEDPAHCILVVKTCAPGISESADQEHQRSFLPFAEWPITQVLQGAHAAPITALSWCGSTGALVSTSADRCVYVWTRQEPGVAFKTDTQFFNTVPQLVMLSAEVLLSPTAVAWSAGGNKLYLGTAGGTVAVGRYDAHQQWWICRILLHDALHAHHHVATLSKGATAAESVVAEANVHDTQHLSSSSSVSFTAASSAPHDRLVVSVVPHASDNTKVAVAFLNGTVQILSTRIKSVDGGVADEPFGCVLFTHRVPCLLHGLAWSSQGQHLAVVGHDSSLHVLCCFSSLSISSTAAAETGPSVDESCTAHAVLRLRTLPLTQCAFASHGRVVAAGFDGHVLVFEAQKDTGWQLVAEGSGSVETAAPNTHRNGAAEGRRSSIPGLCESYDNGGTATQEHEAADVSAKAVTEPELSVKSTRQRAFEFFEKGSGLAPRAEATATASTTTSSTVQALPRDGENAQHASRRSSCASVQLLIPIPQAESSSAAPLTSTCNLFLSSSSDGCVQVWSLVTEDTNGES